MTTSVKCPACGSDPMDRTLYRRLSQSIFMFRRLAALGAGLKGRMEQVWREQFQGARCSVHELVRAIRRNGRLENKAGGFHLVLIRSPQVDDGKVRAMIAGELKRLLRPGGTFWLQTESLPLNYSDWKLYKKKWQRTLDEVGFGEPTELVYHSAAVQPAWMPLLEFRKV